MHIGVVGSGWEEGWGWGMGMGDGEGGAGVGGGDGDGGWEVAGAGVHVVGLVCGGGMG